MKNLYLIAAIVLAAFSTKAQNFYFEDFDGCDLPVGWANVNTVGDTAWVFGDNVAGTPAGSVDGSCMAYIHDDDLGGAADPLIADLISPIVDISSLDTAVLKFDYIYRHLGTQSFEVALWNGADWDTVFTENTSDACVAFFPTCAPRQAEIDLSGYLLADFRMKFIFDDGAAWNWYVGLDNIAIYVPPTDDAVGIEELTLTSGCGLSAAETVSFVIENNGGSEITSITAGYEVGAQSASETFTITIPIGGQDTLVFATPVDMSTVGVYDFAIWTELAGDQDATNDTIFVTQENIPVLSSLPYSEGFESGSGSWAATGGSWELGVPTNTVISEANNGANAWVTNLAGFYSNGENSFVVSPCFDFSTLTVDPVFRFAHIFDTENCCDEGFVDITFDDGATWNRLGLAGQGINWYDDAINNEWDGDGANNEGSQWRTAEHVLDGSAGQASVRIRVGFSSDGSVNAEGFGFDDVEIFEFPTVNAGVTQILSPVNGCGLGSETVTIVVENTGLENVVDYNVAFDAGAGVSTLLVEDTLFVGATDTITFATPADLSTVGDYNIAAWTEVVGDGDPGNDTTFVVVSNIPVVSTLPYSEDFESGAGGWTAGGDNSTWELGDPETAFIDTANSGVNAWVTNLDDIYNNGESSFVESPCFDFSSLNVDPVFRFAFIANSEVNWDGTVIQTSTDAGATWTTVGNVGEGTNWYTNATDNWWDEPFGAADEWTIATHLLDGVAGEGSVKVRVLFSSDGSFNGFDGFAFDDIEIFEQPSINAGVIEVISPVSGCGLGTEDVTIVIENFGDADLVDFNVEYNAGAGIVTELITDTLFSASIDTFTFSTPADYLTTGTFDFGAWTAVSGDGDVLNDSLFTSITSSPIVSTLPYITDFETGADGWYSTGENGVWELGDPEGILIDTANSGVNAWATNLDSTLYGPDQVSYLISPCLDFSSLLIDPILEFALIGNSEAGWDGMSLEVSTDAGSTWSLVGNVGEGTNWFTNDNFFSGLLDQGWDGNTADTVGWVVAEHLIDGVAGESDVIIRFAFQSDDIIFGEGFAIDDISITEQPPFNAEIDEISAPTTACGLTATESIEFTATNLGSVQMDSVIVSYTVNNGPEVMEVFNDTLSPNESGTYTFAQSVDMSAEGDYEITVWVTLDGDGDTSNDTMMVTVTNVPIVSTFPYDIDFENGANGWVATGAEGVWELGEPETAFIDTANSGINAWVTVLDGDYPNLNNDTTYVESPCLDFSTLTDDPLLSFAGIFQTESCCDEGWVEVSVDGGATWTKLGAAGEGINWYNDQFDDFWNGTSGAPNVWVDAEHLLDGTAGQSEVKVRFAFSSDGSVTNPGFGLDDISIREQAQLDLVAISMDAPEGGCELTDSEAVTITFWNKGLTSVGNFDVGFIVDGGAAQIETYPATVATGDTVTHTFTTEFADLSVVGSHTIDVFTALTGDEDLDSDTLAGNQVENFGSSTPLSQTGTPADALLSANNENGTSTELFFCGLPESLDGSCLFIESVTIDSLAHTFMADIDMWLISPAGDTLELSTDNGGATDNMVGVVFTDTASTNIGTVTTELVAGYYAPEDAAGFGALYTGNDPNGAWTLFMDDDAGGDDGQLFSWSINFADNSPTPTLAYSDTTICITQVLTVQVEEYDSYLWSTGNNSQEIDLFGDILGIGTTEVSVTVDENGCTGTSNSFVLTVDACAGINEIEGLSIEVYPNPTAGDIILDIAGESDGFLLEVTDVNGKVVYSETIGEINSSLRRAIDLNSVATGLYFLRLDDGQSSTTRKLIKQ